MKVFLHAYNVSFGRHLTESEEIEYQEVLRQGKNVAGQTGKSIFIMPSSCLPQTKSYNSGIGSISSNYAQNYFKYLQTYLGINVIEDLPAGQVNCGESGLYCAYNASAFGLGNQQINPELLATKEFEYLLTQQDLEDITKGNKGIESFANFKNVMAHTGKQNEILKRAYKKFQKLPDDNPLKQKFLKYKEENSDWLDFQKQFEPDSEYYKFKQFLADEHLKIGKKKLNDKGIKLFGDCLINFNWDEVHANPKAFKKDYFAGLPEWGLPSLDYDNILDESSEASKLLKKKIQLFAKRYDGIRFDVAWAYVTPLITPKGVKEIKDENKKELGSKLLEHIEKWVKEIKGEDFDLNNLIYEFDSDYRVFRAFYDNGELIEPLKGRVKIYGNTYMHENPQDTWGFNEAYTINRGWSPDEYILGVGNHDPQPLRQIANNVPEKIINSEGKIELKYHKWPAIDPLSRILKISKEILQNPIEFARAKWAEPMMSKHNQMFYMDVFGCTERFDMQSFNTTVHPEKNYAYKVPSDYKTAYMQAIRDGFGFNPMDALEKVFKAKGYNLKYPELFKKIIKFKNILLEEEDKKIEYIKNQTETISNTASNSKISKYIWLLIPILGGLTGIYYWHKNKENKQ